LRRRAFAPVGTLGAMPPEFIYTSYKVARHYPPDRTVLEDISISFYPGAKIGVIGPNGAGKSSLLKIMAGLDDGFTGEARLTPGFSVGYLSQEPQLDPSKDVKGNVLDGVREVHDLIEQYNAVMAKWSDPDADYEAIGTEQTALDDRINGSEYW
jgi:sulfate-transporting ATPase